MNRTRAWNPKALGFHTLMCKVGRHRICKGRAQLSGTVCLCQCHPLNWKRAHLHHKAVERSRRG